MENQESKMHLPSLDELFTTQKERDEANLEKVINIKLSDIEDFINHPFKVLENDEMLEMVDSIREKGVLVPAIVRKKDNGKYEMIAGHRRKRACELAELETIPCIVRDLSDDEATIIMVDSNLQREKIFPSERAFAYKMKLEALSHQGKRNDLTSDQVGPKLRANEILAHEENTSVTQIKRFVRLTELLPEFLEMVDNGKIALNPAYELSFLNHEEQSWVLDYIQFNDVTPSLHQTKELKEFSKNGELDIDKTDEILEQEKPNQVIKLKISMQRFSSVLPQNLRDDQSKEDYIYKAVLFYRKHELTLAKQKQLSAR